jgi:hypothetical protein
MAGSKYQHAHRAVDGLAELADFAAVACKVRVDLVSEIRLQSEREEQQCF